ncbi:MAG: helix-turn-helix transcriptional regulator [Candidatus Acidiferrales bacterium]
MSDESYIKEDLIELRKDLHLTQHQMADKLGMAPRAYQSIEAGESEYRYIHCLAVERVALQIAAEKQDPMLAPATLRKDAIELVRVGQLSGKPEFRWDSQRDAPSAQIEGNDPNARFQAAYAVVGELVLMATALDHQLNHVLIQVLHLADSPMLEAVVATLDINRKVEILKARSKYISNKTWQRALETYLDKLEKVSRWRNIACHTALIPDEKHGAVFAPAAAAMLKSLQLGEFPTTKRIPITDLPSNIRLGESALADGQTLLHNFQILNAERAKRFPKNAGQRP